MYPKKPPQVSLPVINAYAAGIDVGSRSHFLAVGQNPEDVLEFSVNTSGHNQAIAFLKQHQIRTIAMESTGSYWQTLFCVLQEAGFQVLLVPGNQTTNARGKTDVKDCQWIQKLHSLGMLSGSFLPDAMTLKLRTLTRHRESLVETVAKYTLKVQKCLRLMNIRLDIAIRDVAGKSGRAIIKSILAGERSAQALSELADPRVKKSQKELAELLNGQWNDELLYELKDCYELMELHEQRIGCCDLEIEKILSQCPVITSSIGESEAPLNADIKSTSKAVALVKKQEKGKHKCTANLSVHCYELLGVDIFAVPGIGPGVALTFISEMGLGIFKFPTAKHFASWLRLTPNNRISGGKILSSRTEKSRNTLTKALRAAANAIGRLKSEDYLAHFFRKIAYKKGWGAAITATARKIAVILWKMIVVQQQYSPQQPEEYLNQIKLRKLKYLQKDIKKHGITMAEVSMLFS
ncbi:MAG: IS110 family transposase [Ferruginibacter sp.]